MSKVVDYYYTPVSPWTYFGHERLLAIAARHGATIRPLPIDLGKIFPVSGGLPLAKRAPQRVAYRLVELARWRDHLGIPMNLQPKFMASSPDLATRWIVAAEDQRGVDAAMRLAGAIMRARFAEDRDIADEATLAALAEASRFDARRVAAGAARPETALRYEASTQKAIDCGVFGAPWYVYRDEPFWGQDRLDFLDRALAR